MLSCLFRIWWKISFDPLLTCSANMTAHFWPLFLYCWNFFHHVSKVHSAGGDTGANVDLSYGTKSVTLSLSKEQNLFHNKEKTAFWLRRPSYFASTNLPFALVPDTWRLWCRKGRPILNIKTVFNHVPYLNSKWIGALWKWTYSFFEDGAWRLLMYVIVNLIASIYIEIWRCSHW